MNSIIIGQTIEIPQLVIAELNGVNKELVVHSIITTTNALAEKLYTQLHPNEIVQLNGLTFLKKDKFVIFIASLEQFEAHQEIVLLFLYIVSQYIHFHDSELQQIGKIFDQLPLLPIQKQAPKISLKYQSNFRYFRLSKKHLQIGGKPKMIGRFRMTGTMLLNLMLDFCEYQNTNKKITENLFQGVFNRECYRKYEEVRNKFHQQIVKIQSEQKIYDTEELQQRLTEYQQDVFVKLFDCVACSEMKQTFVEFMSYCCDSQKTIFVANHKESEKYCNALLQSYLNLFITECKNTDEIVSQKDIYIKQKWASFEEILKGYLSDAQGPNKFNINEQITNMIFEQSDQWFEALNSHYMFELNKSKAQLMQAVENYQELQNRLAEVEGKKFELENMNQGLMFELESQKRESEKIAKIKEVTEEICQSRTSESVQKIAKIKEKNKKYKEQLEKQQEENRKLAYEVNEMKKEKINNIVKIQHYEKALDQAIQKSQQDGFEKELLQLITQFKERLELSSRDSLISGQSRLSNDSSSFRVLEKLQLKYDKVKEKCKQLEDEVTQLRRSNEQLEKKNSENEISIHTLNNELSTRLSIEESEKLIREQKQRDQDLFQVLQSHKTTIEKMNEKHSQLENQYYQRSIEFSNLEFQRGNTLTILREAIKYQQKKQNTLVTILKSMPSEQQQEIKEILHQVGFKM